MKIRIIYFSVYLMIAVIVYGTEKLMGDFFQHKKLVQFVVLIALAAIADKLIKKFIGERKNN